MKESLKLWMKIQIIMDGREKVNQIGFIKLWNHVYTFDLKIAK